MDEGLQEQAETLRTEIALLNDRLPPLREMIARQQGRLENMVLTLAIGRWMNFALATITLLERLESVVIPRMISERQEKLAALEKV